MTESQQEQHITINEKSYRVSDLPDDAKELLHAVMQNRDLRAMKEIEMKNLLIAEKALGIDLQASIESVPYVDAPSKEE